MLQTTLTRELFPDPEKRGVVIEPVCLDIEIHIWRLLLDHLANGRELSLAEFKALGFQDKKPRLNRGFLLQNSLFANQRVALLGETPGVITYDFPDSDTHIMRSILANNGKLDRGRMLASLDKRDIDRQIRNALVPEIEKTDDLWFINLFLFMLREVGSGLAKAEEDQLLVNLTWFNQEFI